MAIERLEKKLGMLENKQPLKYKGRQLYLKEVHERKTHVAERVGEPAKVKAFHSLAHHEGPWNQLEKSGSCSQGQL
eukprot:11155628-Lingulodinium_polyedra.AAC.1